MCVCEKEFGFSFRKILILLKLGKPVSKVYFSMLKETLDECFASQVYDCFEMGEDL